MKQNIETVVHSSTESLHFYFKRDSNTGVLYEYYEMFKNGIFIEDQFVIPFRNFIWW